MFTVEGQPPIRFKGPSSKVNHFFRTEHILKIRTIRNKTHASLFVCRTVTQQSEPLLLSEMTILQSDVFQNWTFLRKLTPSTVNLFLYRSSTPLKLNLCFVRGGASKLVRIFKMETLIGFHVVWRKRFSCFRKGCLEQWFTFEGVILHLWYGF